MEYAWIVISLVINAKLILNVLIVFLSSPFLELPAQTTVLIKQFQSIKNASIAMIKTV
jgi:hypothetical protein